MSLMIINNCWKIIIGKFSSQNVSILTPPTLFNLLMISLYNVMMVKTKIGCYQAKTAVFNATIYAITRETAMG